MSFGFLFLYLIMAHSGGQGQGHVIFFYCESGDRFGKYYLMPFYRVTYWLSIGILHLTLVHSEGQVKVRHIIFANILLTVTVIATIIIAITEGHSHPLTPTYTHIHPHPHPPSALI